MSLFHIAIAGNTLSIMSVATGYTIERQLEAIPQEVREELCRNIFYTVNLKKNVWTKTAIELSMASPVRQYFLFERAEELREMEEEYTVVSAMARYADCLPVLENA